MNKNTISATAFILIGGKSERFGSPKWKAKINGKSVLDIVWDACNSFENRIIVGKEKLDGFEKPFIQDTLKINAPMNGLYTALSNTKTDWILLLSCDLPLIDSKIFKKLWESRKENCDAVIPIANDKMQVTCGFYHKRIWGKLESEIEKGNYSIFKLLYNLNSSFVDFGEDDRFLNMNTPEDHEAISDLFIH
jgi:molybdopterin-guanine dinucleotide biosynthesis protein A